MYLSITSDKNTFDPCIASNVEKNCTEKKTNDNAVCIYGLDNENVSHQPDDLHVFGSGLLSADCIDVRNVVLVYEYVRLFLQKRWFRFCSHLQDCSTRCQTACHLTVADKT